MMPEPITDVKCALSKARLKTSDYDLNPDIVLPEGRTLRPAGVLVAISETKAGLQVYLTKRSSALKHHPGQIAFPGGKQDEGDRDVIAAALREAWEEIGLEPDNVDVMGTLPSHETVTSFTVTPVVARVLCPFDPTPEVGEVDEVFTVPLSHLLEPENFTIESRRWRGRSRRYYTVPFGPYYIWGATARILRSMADVAGAI
jgi:8-oxo-dGTP pyrophosphatase MutT (NUDIX family)